MILNIEEASTHDYEEENPIEAEPEIDAVPPQFRSPSEGDSVQVFSRDKNDWRTAVTIKTDKRILKKYPNYYNVRYSDNYETGSVELNSESLWRFLDPDRQQFFWWRWGHLYDRGPGGNEGGQEGVTDEDAARDEG